MRPLVDCAEHGAVVRLLADRHGDMKRSGAGASASRSIFIASSTTIGSPSRTGAPSSASQRTTVPPSSAVTGVPSAAVLASDVGAGRERPPNSAASRPESTPGLPGPPAFAMPAPNAIIEANEAGNPSVTRLPSTSTQLSTGEASPERSPIARSPARRQSSSVSEGRFGSSSSSIQRVYTRKFALDTSSSAPPVCTRAEIR